MKVPFDVNVKMTMKMCIEVDEETKGVIEIFVSIENVPIHDRFVTICYDPAKYQLLGPSAGGPAFFVRMT